MLLFSPPRCDFLLGKAQRGQTAFTSKHISNPLWPSRPASTAPLPHSREPISTPQSAPPRPRPTPHTMSNSDNDTSYFSGTPRSPSFSPTLGCIPEVFEHEALDAKPLDPGTPLESPALETEAFTPEPSAVVEPRLSLARTRAGYIQSPPRKVISARAVCKVLRQVLEADRLRRRRIMRAYLKAIVFLKYLWRANERYGNVMVTTGMYMQR